MHQHFLVFIVSNVDYLLQSTNIGLSAYDSPWYGWTKKERKIIEIIIFRSQIVAYLSAGKFAHMSLQTFSSVSNFNFT